MSFNSFTAKCSLDLLKITNTPEPSRHPKCKGYMINTPDCYEFDCEYGSELTCDECKYGGCGGRKDPEAKCNQLK